VSSISIAKELLIEANQRKLHRSLMAELVAYWTKKDLDGGKQTASLYWTSSWEQRSRAIFFYFHPSLGNMDMELTCSLFSINIWTFKNWITKKPMFAKWVHYVQCFTVSDILPSVPAQYRKHYDDVDHSDKVSLDPKFGEADSKVVFVSSVSASVSTRQKVKKISLKDQQVKYLRKTTKTVGSGRKVKYEEQENFIVEAVVMSWETGKPCTKSDCYNLLMRKFTFRHSFMGIICQLSSTRKKSNSVCYHAVRDI